MYSGSGSTRPPLWSACPCRTTSAPGRGVTAPCVLRLLREWAGMSQTDVARSCGCSVASVRAWEAGRTVPALRNRTALERLHALVPGFLDPARRGYGSLGPKLDQRPRFVVGCRGRPVDRCQGEESCS
ncbi:multiprotein-bridging factor 1 family protein [Aeromicrobium sp. 9AM]|uniref:helix-turn-helix domain-containing protein n=1 Tax=Aeromicrobium sp. 9AM TaxID=2653126 RepID=UPI00352A76BB